MYLSFDADDMVQGTANYADQSGNGNHATNHNASAVEGIYGMAAFFNGIDAYLEVPDSESMDSINGPEFTFIVSVNVLSVRNGDKVFNRFNTLGLGMNLNDDNDNVWTYHVSQFRLAQTRNVSANQWLIFAGRYRNGQLTAFVDGEQIWQGNAQQPAWGDALYIAKSVQGGRSGHMNIDEFSFYDTALSDAEIQNYFAMMR